MKTLYFDNNASSAILPEVREAMLPALLEHYGNPSSAHPLGRNARRLVDESRERVARILEARSGEIYFTSGATESNAMALQGCLRAQSKRKKIIVSAVEHPSVLNLSLPGFERVEIPVDHQGCLDLDCLESVLDSETAIVSIMVANNETGVLNPVSEIARLTHQVGAYFHVDAVQAVGKVKVSVRDWDVDFLSLSAHKFHGPKGIGVLFARKGIQWEPLLQGGGQERGKRGGTENVAGILGMAEALKQADVYLPDYEGFVGQLRDRLEKELLNLIPGSLINGHQDKRIANTLNISIPGIESEALLLSLSNEMVCAASGSACSTGATQLSHVLTAMGLDADRIRGAVRFSLSRLNTEEELDLLLDLIPDMIQRIRLIEG